MTTKSGRELAATRVRIAEDAANELREALATRDVLLPSLRIDPVSCARADPTPLVDLGRCTPDVAHRLATVLRNCPR